MKRVSSPSEKRSCKETICSPDFAKIVLRSPDGRAHVNAAKKLGFQEAQIQNPLFREWGRVAALLRS